MNAELTLEMWGQAAAVIGGEILLVVLAAAVVERASASSAWRRLIWQTAAIAIPSLLLLEITGAGSVLTHWSLTPAPASSDLFASHSALDEGFRLEVESRLTARQAPPPPVPSADVGTGRPEPVKVVWWPALVWAAGSMAVLLWAIGAHCLLVLYRRRQPELENLALHSRMREIAARVGWRGPIRLIRTSDAVGPVAFGWRQATIGLPDNFATEYSPAEQDAVLAHELAHLVQRDPFWKCAIDLLAAALWWHPAVWWLRHQLLLAMEANADAASQVVQDGPRSLAACLVRFGRRLAPRRLPGGSGMGGSRFQSQLGRRVERLVNLPSESLPLHSPARTRWLTRTACLLSVLLVTGLSSAWTSNKGHPMNTMQHAWRTSLGGLAVVAALSAEPMAAEPAAAPPPERAPATEPRTFQEPAPVPAPAPETRAPGENGPELQHHPVDSAHQHMMDPAMLERYGLRGDPRMGHPPARPLGARRQALEAKLEGVVFEEVLYDGLPLDEVVRDLIEQSRRRDPEGLGVNFVLSRFTPSGNGAADALFNPAMRFAAEPPVHTPVDLANTIIQLRPPLRNVRLKDVLDVIPRVADQPIRYSIEEYGIVFSLDPNRLVSAPQADPFSGVALTVQTFRVDSTQLRDSLKRAFGFSGQDEPREIRQELLRVLKEFGADLALPGRSLIYNDLTGMIVIRGSPSDIEVAQAVIETLGGDSASREAELPSGRRFAPAPASESSFPTIPARSSRTPSHPSPSPAPEAGMGSQSGMILRAQGTVAVIGAVNKPGSYTPVGHEWSVIDAIAVAGGLAPLAAGREIKFSRDGKTQVLSFDELKTAPDSEKIKVQPGDIIAVPSRVW